MRALVFGLLLSASTAYAKKPELTQGGFFAPAFAEAVLAGRFDPLAYPTSRPRSLRFDKRRVTVDHGQETVALRYRFTREDGERRLEVLVGDAWSPRALRWVDDQRIETDLFGEVETLVWLPRDVSHYEREHEERLRRETLTRLAGRYEGPRRLVIAPEGVRLDGRLVRVTASSCFSGCAAERRTVCLTLGRGKTAQLLAEVPSGLVEGSPGPGLCPLGPAFVPGDVTYQRPNVAR